MRKPNKKLIALAVATVLLAGTGTAAFAYWTATGTGVGTAVSSVGNSSLTATNVAPAGVDPGIAAQSLQITVKNNGTSTAQMSQVVTQLTSVTPVGSNICSVSNYTLTPANGITTSAQSIGAGANSTTITGPTVAFNNNASTDQSGCKGATLNFTHTVS